MFIRTSLKSPSLSLSRSRFRSLFSLPFLLFRSVSLAPRVHMGVQHKSDNRRIHSGGCGGDEAAVEIMYHEFIIASTMLISERETAPTFGYGAGDRWVLSEIASVRDSVPGYHRRAAITRLVSPREIGRDG